VLHEYVPSDCCPPKVTDIRPSLLSSHPITIASILNAGRTSDKIGKHLCFDVLHAASRRHGLLLHTTPGPAGTRSRCLLVGGPSGRRLGRRLNAGLLEAETRVEEVKQIDRKNDYHTLEPNEETLLLHQPTLPALAQLSDTEDAAGEDEESCKCQGNEEALERPAVA